MRNRNVVVLALAVGLVGCNYLKKLKGGGDDAAVEATTTADTSDAAPSTDDGAAPEDAADSGAADVVVFANEKDVKRFPDEEKLASDEYATEWATTTPRSEPGTGAVIVSLPKGSKCKMVARKGQSVLVSFADPKDATRTLIGWVAQNAFVAGTAPPPVTLNLGGGGAKKTTATCPAGLTLLIDQDAFCGKTCIADKDCKSLGAGIVCQGQAKPITTTGLGSVVNICVKGAAPKPDAGTTTTPAATASSTPTATPDSGPAPATTTTTTATATADAAAPPATAGPKVRGHVVR